MLIALAGVGVYLNSCAVPFLFDDIDAIVDNPQIRHLWPIWRPLLPPNDTAVAGRPIVNVTLALNYAISRHQVWSYHLVNIAIHVWAGLTLYAVIRRTFRSPRLAERYGSAADGLALAVALLWTVHPLQTESVTYVSTRTESLMALFYLLTLYCVIRGAATSPQRQRRWYSAAIAACALGMASKEVMVSAPLMVLLYDRALLAGSFAEVFRRRWHDLYAGLAATWVLLAVIVFSAARTGSVGLWSAELTPVVYAQTQLGILVHYLRLVFWPWPLVLDYAGWPIARSLVAVWPQAMLILALAVCTFWGLWRNSSLGLLGAWFFVILAPTSSVLPIHTEIAAERRMYLPLAAVLVLTVCVTYAPLRALYDRLSAPAPVRRNLLPALVVAAGTLLGALTIQRNRQYQDELALWQDLVTRWPSNARAHNNLGIACTRRGLNEQAVRHGGEAVRLEPDNAEYRRSLGFALVQLRRTEEAVTQLETALKLEPDDPLSHFVLALARSQQGRLHEAADHYLAGLRFRPDDAHAHQNLADVLVQLGRHAEAAEHYRRAAELRP